MDFGLVHSLPSTRSVSIQLINGGLHPVLLLDATLIEPNSAVTIRAETKTLLAGESRVLMTVNFRADKVNAIKNGRIIIYLLYDQQHLRFELPYHISYSLGSVGIANSSIQLFPEIPSCSTTDSQCWDKVISSPELCRAPGIKEKHTIRLKNFYDEVVQVIAARSSDLAITTIPLAFPGATLLMNSSTTHSLYS